MEIGVVIVCLLLNAFFSGMEIAFISSNKIYLELEKSKKDFLSTILTKLTEDPSKFIAAMLIGNTITLVIYGFLMGELMLSWLCYFGFHFSEYLNIIIQILFTTTIVLLTSKFLPRVFFQIYANTFIKAFSLPAYFFYLLFYYVSSFFIWISDVVLKIGFKMEGNQVSLYFSKAELGSYITEQLSAVEDEEEVDSEIQIFQNALVFSEVKAKDIMTPKEKIVTIDVLDSVLELKELFSEVGYSKILVHQKSLDNIIGYVHFFDLFKKPKSVKSIVIPVQFVSESILIKDAMDLLIKKRKSVAVVLDECESVSGIITIEDIVEELFGEIEDEFDSEEE